ncbi:hypothetical protein C1646_760162 [Rhizophagus diaphanus]|nr:hypothetical protein C1646_760162 [Rhizophagus diaphanus] [Rhizophagus sp. MUCL 43196]
MSIISFPSAVTPMPSVSSPVSVLLIITSTSNFTLDEKRDLLFDINRTLEILIDSFNDNTRQKENIPNEKHQIIKTWPSEVDRIKWPKAIRALVEIEVGKNYSPLAITSAIKEYATSKLGLGKYARELKRKEMSNIKYKVREPTESDLLGNSDLKLDISESVSYLTEQGYLVKTYRISQWSTKGIIFVHPEQLKKFERHRWLMLIDLTHKTNQYDWRLFTLYVCDIYGCWNVDAHFFASNENADTVAEALIIIRNKYNKYCHWSSHYILSDQSNIKAKSIKKAFPA